MNYVVNEETKNMRIYKHDPENMRASTIMMRMQNHPGEGGEIRSGPDTIRFAADDQDVFWLGMFAMASMMDREAEAREK